MNDWPYHQYLFYELSQPFYQLPTAERRRLTSQFGTWLTKAPEVAIVPYATIGFKPHTTLVLWIRAHQPTAIQNAVRELAYSPIGQYFILQHSLFGLVRQTTYSKRPQKSDQVIRANERLPYLIIYPFTKTPEWHLLPFEERTAMMKAHILIGIQHTQIRQCLLYSYGVDDHEFVVSYETPTLEAFQDLVMQLRPTEVRRYTQNDLPVYTCVYKSPEELAAWL